MKIIIYATHSFGTYETLKAHPDVVVLGFGTKWGGFIEKAKIIHKYLDTLPNNEVVAVIDGFDSYIKKTDNLKKEFDKMNSKVVVSLHHSSIPKVLDNYITPKVFTQCKDNHIANSGLIMGYVEYLKIVWYKIINGPTNDDQGNLNLACKELPFLKIDAEQVIFQNCTGINELNNSKAYLCQIPATPSFHRVTRSITEYSEYFIPEITIVSILVVYSIYFFVKRLKYSQKTKVKFINKKSNK